MSEITVVRRVEQDLPPGTLQQAAGGDPLNPRVGAAPEGPTPGRGAVGGTGQQRKTAAHRPKPPVSPATSPKGRGGTEGNTQWK